jgi:general secretion pathway protein C
MTIRNLNIINAALILLIFPVMAFLVKDYLVYRRVRSAGPPVEAVRSSPVHRGAIQGYAPIVEAPVFPTPSRTFSVLGGFAPESGSAPDPAAASSGLKLVGTFVGSEAGAPSLAVFEKAGERAQKIFKVGEVVFGAGPLTEVGRERAVLRLGSLDIPFIMERRERPKGAPQRRAPGSRYSKKTGKNRWVLSQEAVLDALGDMGAVLTSARLTPVVRGGAVEGFLVTEIKPRGIMDALGLKNGDILKRVNGYEMTSPERAVQVLTALKGETSFELDIVRKGQPRSFHYEVR